MPTYDGSKITTGTLYEDGTISVKNGFTGVREVSALGKPQMVSSRIKAKIFSVTQGGPVDTSSLNKPELLSSKQKTKILPLTSDEENKASLCKPSVVGSRQKTVIIIP